MCTLFIYLLFEYFNRQTISSFRIHNLNTLISTLNFKGIYVLKTKNEK